MTDMLHRSSLDLVARDSALDELRLSVPVAPEARGALATPPVRTRVPSASESSSGGAPALFDLRVSGPVLLVLVVQAVESFGHLGRGGATALGSLLALAATVLVAATARLTAGRVAAGTAASVLGLGVATLWSAGSARASGAVLLVAASLLLSTGAAASARRPRRHGHAPSVARRARLELVGCGAAVVGAWLLAGQPAAVACAGCGVVAAGLSCRLSRSRSGSGSGARRATRGDVQAGTWWLTAAGSAELILLGVAIWSSPAWPTSALMTPAALAALLLSLPAGVGVKTLVGRWQGRAVLPVLGGLLAFAAVSAALMVHVR